MKSKKIDFFKKVISKKIQTVKKINQKFQLFFNDFFGKFKNNFLVLQIKFLRLIFYTFLICIFAEIPLFGIDYKTLSKALNFSKNGVLLQTLLNYASFSPYDNFYLNPFSLGILPYVNASLFIDLLIKNVSLFEKFLNDEGPAAKEKIKFFKKLMSLIFGCFYIFLLYSIIKDYFYFKNFSYFLFFSLQLLSGSLILIWISDKIDDLSIVNGVSFLLSINLIKNIKTLLPISFDFNYIFFLLFFSFLIYIQQNGKYSINVISSKQFSYFDNLKKKKKTGIIYDSEDQLEILSNDRVIQQSKIYLRLNPGGIYPLIIASSLLTFLSSLFSKSVKILFFEKFTYLFYPFYFFLLIFSCYSYSYLYFDPVKIREEFLKNSIYIPGIEPGEATEKYLIEITLINSIISGIYLSSILGLFQIFKQLSTNQFNNLLNLSSIIIFIGIISEIKTNLSLTKINIENAKNYESSFISQKNMSKLPYN